MVALFRIVELVSGSISIDGVDISKLGLNDVRNAISIIPQDSTLCMPKLIEYFGVLTSIFLQSPGLCGPTWIPLDSTMTHDSGMHLDGLTSLRMPNLSQLWSLKSMTRVRSLEQELRYRMRRALRWTAQ